MAKIYLREIPLILILLFNALTPCLADVIYKEAVTVSAASAAMPFKQSITKTTYLKGAKMLKEVVNTKSVTGGVEKEEVTINIFRLDKGVAWYCWPDRKEYAEMPIDAIMAMAKLFMLPMVQQSAAPAGKDVFSLAIKENEGTRTINNLLCKNVVITVTRDIESDAGQPGKIIFTFDFWDSTQVPGLQEINQFGKKMMAKLEMPPSSYGAFLAYLPSLGASGGAVKKAFKKISQLAAQRRAYPVVARFKVDIIPPKDNAPQKTTEEQIQTGPDDIEGLIGGLVSDKLEEEVEKKFAGFEEMLQNPPSGESTLISSQQTTLSVSEFLPPAGFKKLETSSTQ